MVRLIALYEVLRFGFARVVCVPLELHIRNNFSDDNAPDQTCFRVPLDMIAAFELRCHFQFQARETERILGCVVNNAGRSTR